MIPASGASGQVSTIEALAEVPEAEIWLAKQKSKRTRRAYKMDVEHFMRTLMIRTYDEVGTPHDAEELCQAKTFWPQLFFRVR